MTLYYVSDRGSNSNNGTSTSTPKATFTAVEALVAAGDTVWVQGNSTFRETHTTTTSGTSGNPISFLNDTSGKVFGDAGGYSRITGSDDDQTVTRANAISCVNSYRKWAGFLCDSTSSNVFTTASSTSDHFTLEDMTFFGRAAAALDLSNNIASGTMRRCTVWCSYTNDCVSVDGFSTYGGLLFENCVFMAARSGYGIRLRNCGSGCAINNCLVNGAVVGFAQESSGSGHTVTNCLIRACEIGVSKDTTSSISATNCGFDGCGTNLATGTTDGGGNQTYPIVFVPFTRLGSGLYAPFIPFMPLGGYVNLGGSTAPSDDYTGAPRSQGTAMDRGPVEWRGRVSPYTGGGITITGKGFHDFSVVCDAGKTVTVTADVSWTDNTNIGTKPRLEMFDDAGVSVGTPSDATGSGSVETLSVSYANASGLQKKYWVRVYNRTTYTTNNNLTINAVVNDPTFV